MCALSIPCLWDYVNLDARIKAIFQSIFAKIINQELATNFHCLIIVKKYCMALFFGYTTPFTRYENIYYVLGKCRCCPLNMRCLNSLWRIRLCFIKLNCIESWVIKPQPAWSHKVRAIFVIIKPGTITRIRQFVPMQTSFQSWSLSQSTVIRVSNSSSQIFTHIW